MSMIRASEPTILTIKSENGIVAPMGEELGIVPGAPIGAPGQG